MNYNKIRWCTKQNKGIKLIEPNESISQNYLKESAEDYKMIEKIMDWKECERRIFIMIYNLYQLIQNV